MPEELSKIEKLCPFCAETIKAAAVKCKHCGSTLQQDQQSKTQPVKDDSAWIFVGVVGMLAMVGVCMLGLAGVAFYVSKHAGHKGNTPSVEITSAHTTHSDLVVEEPALEGSTPYGGDIYGSVRNKGSKTYGYVQVLAAGYDVEGNLTDNAFANASNLEPGKSWSFTLHFYHHPEKYKITSVTGF